MSALVEAPVETHRVRISLGTVGVASRYVRVPKGIGPGTFKSWCVDRSRWLETEDGLHVRAAAIVAFRFEEAA